MTSNTCFQRALLEQLVEHQQQLSKQASVAGAVAEQLTRLCSESTTLVADFTGCFKDIDPLLSGSVPQHDATDLRTSGLRGCLKEMDPPLPGSVPQQDARILMAAGLRGKAKVDRSNDRTCNELNPPVARTSQNNFVENQTSKTSQGNFVEGRVTTAGRVQTMKTTSSFDDGNSSDSRSPARAITVMLPQRSKTGRLFADAEALKEQVRDHCIRDQYDITAFYNEFGVCQEIARSPYFETASLVVVVLSSIWIAIEIDFMEDDMLYSANPVFPIVANFFGIFFLFEIIIRIGALKDKARVFKESSLLFDASLVALIAAETWLVAIVMALTGRHASTGNMRIIVVFRTLRLLRVLRLGRVLRELPELLVIIRGLASSFRGIAVMIMILTMLMYLAAIVFRVLLEGTDLGDDRFDSIPSSMGTLLIEATLSGAKGGPLLREAYAESIVYSVLLLVFVLFANIMMMGMIVGLLVQTVRAVAEAEREEGQVKAVQESLNNFWAMFVEADADGDGCIDLPELLSLVKEPETRECFTEMGVDLEGLVNISAFIFEQHGGKLTRPQFRKMVLDIRGKEAAKVKDHVETRKFIHSEFQDFFRQRRQLD